jgi:hypothetical protein
MVEQLPSSLPAHSAPVNGTTADSLRISHRPRPHSHPLPRRPLRVAQTSVCASANPGLHLPVPIMGRALPMQYHQAVDKLLLYLFGPLVFAAALLVIATGIRLVITRLRSRPTSDQLKAAYEAYLHRLLNPQPEAVERELGKLLPERLLQLYQDKTAIQAAGFQLDKPGGSRWWPKRWQVYCFEPLDLESLNDLPYEEELGPGFCFATTGRRSWYWIAASDQREKDSPVIYLDYDGGGSHCATVANSLDEFLNLPRLPTQ